MIGMTEILVVAAVGLFFFGGNKVLEWAKNLGKVKKEFEKASKEDNDKEKI